MDSHPILYRTLTDAWHAPSGPAANPIPSRWISKHPMLAGLTTLDSIVEVCNRRGVPELSSQVLAALVELAPSEPLAARTALQALLPGLAALSRRAPGFVGSGRLWATVGELDQELVALCCERLLDGTAVGCRWPAVRVRDAVWRRVRTLQAEHIRRRAREVSMNDYPHHLASTVRDDYEEHLVKAVCRAVESGRLRRDDASLVLRTRLLDVTPAQIARDAGVDVRALRTRRRRVEARLLADVA
jgi:hypothetical protein